MPSLQINIHDLDETEEQERFQPISRRRQYDQEGRVARRRPLSADDARDQGRKPRTARQFARSSEMVL
ncbi:MAG: hypothetical protein RI947_1120 [Candidatus Parcubacteria bacterium]|jgi:hypothetical protein